MFVYSTNELVQHINYKETFKNHRYAEKR